MIMLCRFLNGLQNWKDYMESEVKQMSIERVTAERALEHLKAGHSVIILQSADMTSLTIADWLTGYSPVKDATYVRGFLGRMLFAGEDGVKKMRVLSGGEKVRVLLSRMMIMGSNVLMFDEPTDHLDMESITALNNGMIKFPGVILFACRDHQVVQTTANRIIEFLPDGTMIDKVSTYDEYLESDVMARKRQVYNTTADEEADD